MKETRFYVFLDALPLILTCGPPFPLMAYMNLKLLFLHFFFHFLNLFQVEKKVLYIGYTAKNTFLRSLVNFNICIYL